MRKFANIGEFIGFLDGVAAALPAAQRAGIAAGLKVVITEAASMPGEYQSGDEAGGFPDWEPLAPGTLDGFGPLPGKIADGFAPPDNPLKASGAMAESYQYEVVSDDKGIGGSPDPISRYQELGTDRRGIPFVKGATTDTGHGIPARSVLARAAFRKAQEAARAAAIPILRLFTDNIQDDGALKNVDG